MRLINWLTALVLASGYGFSVCVFIHAKTSLPLSLGFTFRYFCIWARRQSRTEHSSGLLTSQVTPSRFDLLFFFWHDLKFLIIWLIALTSASGHGTGLWLRIYDRTELPLASGFALTYLSTWIRLHFKRKYSAGLFGSHFTKGICSTAARNRVM